MSDSANMLHAAQMPQTATPGVTLGFAPTPATLAPSASKPAKLSNTDVAAAERALDCPETALDATVAACALAPLGLAAWRTLRPTTAAQSALAWVATVATRPNLANTTGCARAAARTWEAWFARLAWLAWSTSGTAGATPSRAPCGPTAARGSAATCDAAEPGSTGEPNMARKPLSPGSTLGAAFAAVAHRAGAAWVAGRPGVAHCTVSARAAFFSTLPSMTSVAASSGNTSRPNGARDPLVAASASGTLGSASASLAERTHRTLDTLRARLSCPSSETLRTRFANLSAFSFGTGPSRGTSGTTSTWCTPKKLDFGNAALKPQDDSAERNNLGSPFAMDFTLFLALLQFDFVPPRTKSSHRLSHLLGSSTDVGLRDGLFLHRTRAGIGSQVSGSCNIGNWTIASRCWCGSRARSSTCPDTCNLLSSSCQWAVARSHGRRAVAQPLPSRVWKSVCSCLSCIGILIEVCPHSDQSCEEEQ
mmetsp:Transcript_28962/g.67072  ORF Transcript_28962/g.67072 Transcript_28962/m.67072 type:complete len:478 (-) Transcript_28962:26-1459(-)